MAPFEFRLNIGMPFPGQIVLKIKADGDESGNYRNRAIH